jgi:hypothetical protein
METLYSGLKLLGCILFARIIVCGVLCNLFDLFNWLAPRGGGPESE